MYVYMCVYAIIWDGFDQLEWFLNPLFVSVCCDHRWALSICRARPVWDKSLLCDCSETCNSWTCSSSRWLLGSSWFFVYNMLDWICTQKYTQMFDMFVRKLLRWWKWSGEREREGGRQREMNDIDLAWLGCPSAISPSYFMVCWGCHFDRRTLETIQGAGFAAVDGDYFELENCGFLNPTVAGIATVWKERWMLLALVLRSIILV